MRRYVSVPRSTPDRKTYALPVGAEQFHQWQRLVDPVETEEDGEPPKPSDAARNPRFRVDYHQDPRALKLISQDAWEVPLRANAAPDARSRPARRVIQGDRPYADVEYWNALKKKRGEAGEVFERGNYYIEAQRCLNYMRCADAQTLVRARS